MRKHKFSILIVLIFLTGLSVLLYPAASGYINSRNQSRIISEYDAAFLDSESEAGAKFLAAANEHNARLAAKTNRFILTNEELAQYYGMLDITGRGIMGYVEIETIGVKLPIYHGADENILQIGIGHLEWSSLPVGGLGTHAVLTGHTGLPSATMLNNLNKLDYGDTFVLRVLGEELTYRVEQIHVVEPSDISALTIDADMDYCTLITCTPYGVNSHRLLVRGERVPNSTEGNMLIDVIRGCFCPWCIIIALVALLVALSALVVSLVNHRKLRRLGKNSNGV